ncbi:2598_t:CDS:2 [Diversispora eburnea]|uniref:2598_t:CDS:1 n=1 Tax=Diversispora eburnea TaxID=1213867 RepID=A0A9N8ZH56_9GLOM|nr:2598_t:CDS:2 [Diversispora eburnea]
MATKIPTEIIIKILNNVQSEDLHSSLLVNRIWCKVTIPILWELILDHEYYSINRKTSLCIRTYISCMNTQTRTLLIQNGFDLSSSPPQATFDYPSFTHKIIINNLANLITIYSQQIIDYFSLAKVNYSCPYKDLIGSILELPGALKVFKKLKDFTSMRGNISQIVPLYESLLLICDNILNMNLSYFSFTSSYQEELFSKLISVQKQLENLTIFAFTKLDYSLFWAIISQKETLKSLHLKFARFYNFEGVSSPIGQIISLQELDLQDCYEFHKPECLFLASSFIRLSSFHYWNLKSEHDGYRHPQEFIVKILETANTNLKNIRLDLRPKIPFDIFSTILNYCTKVTNLTLCNLSPEQVIAIFNNNFNELKRFSFGCEKGLDADELLCQMAKNVPESLETIEINMVYDNFWKFSADSLRKFLDGWCCKGGGGRVKRIIIKNKKNISKRIPLNILELLPYTLTLEHFKVIEEYGIKFNLVEYY